jgi:hypothetical protein
VRETQSHLEAAAASAGWSVRGTPDPGHSQPVPVASASASTSTASGYAVVTRPHGR